MATARKLRVLLSGESSFLSTGYSKMGMEILSRLHASEKYEVFELGAFGKREDPRAANLPWPYMSVLPASDNQAEMDGYNSSPTNQFGEWRFEEACLWAKPDVCFSFRDVWQEGFLFNSPFRPYYRLAVMPTVDSLPQGVEFLSQYAEADAVFTYTDWAGKALIEEGGGRLKYRGSAPPGVDTAVFKPVPDRKAHRRAIGMDENAFIVGMCARNQARKLYPDLAQAFALFLREAPAELSKKTFLYLHTTWPDLGWNIPRILLEEGLTHKVLFTYMCGKCGAAYPAFFSDTRMHCVRCGQPDAFLANSNVGVSPQILSSIYSLMDVYVQYATNEGFGIPLVEAAACGTPVMAVDYSAMAEVVRKLGGTPLKVARMFRDPPTHYWRALPSNEDFVQKLINFLSLPEPYRLKAGYTARKAVEENYTWDRCVAAWAAYFDGLTPTNSWDGPAKLHQPRTDVPQGLSNGDFVNWSVAHTAGRPDLINSFLAQKMVRDLNWGYSLGFGGGLAYNDASALGLKENVLPQFGREKVRDICLAIANKKNYFEQLRYSSRTKS